MRIALFHEVNAGGARRATQEFAKALRELGHTVDAYIVDEQNISNKEQTFFSSVHHFDFNPIAWNGKNWKVRLYRDTIELWKLSQLHKRIAAEIDTNSYDVVFAHPSKWTQASFVLRYVKTKSIYYCQEPLRIVYDPVFAIPKLPFHKYAYEWLNRFVRKIIDASNIQSADVVLANSNFTRSNILKAYGIQATTLHMGVDTSVFYPGGKKDINLLFVGTRDVEEGYGLFQEALSMLPQTLQKKLRVKYLIRGENWTSNDKELRDIYARTHVVMCLGYNEPFGLVPIEAMACGATVIALKEGGYLDSVKDGKTGVFVGRSAGEIVKVLQKLIVDTKNLRKMEKNATEEMRKNWTWKTAGITLESIGKG